MSAALESLANRIEAGAGADRALDAAIAMAVFPPLRACRPVSPGIWIDAEGGRVRALRYTASRPAAITLIPVGHWLASTDEDENTVRIESPDEAGQTAIGRHIDPIRAIAAAALRSRANALRGNAP